MLLLYAVALGIVAGLLTKGRLSGIGSIHIKFWPVALLGLGFQLLLFSPVVAQGIGRLGPSLYVLSTTLVLMTLVVNLRLPGVWLIVVGALLNFTVIVLNHGFMPASPDAVAALLGSPVLPTADYTNSALATSQTTLAFLGDIFALPRPLPLANVFSIGDVLIGLGGAWFVVRTMHSGAPSAEMKQQPATGRNG